MKKIFKIENLDCANCAIKMETAVNKIDKVISANVSFMTQKLVIEIEDEYFDVTIEKVKKTLKKINSDWIIK